MILGVIPARYASTRFPGKLLADLHGKSILEHTWRRAKEASRLDRLIIAAADAKISSAANAFGAEVIEIYHDFKCGSDRIAEAVKQLENTGERIEVVVNIQGDEPLLDPGSLDDAVERLEADPGAAVATPIAPIRSRIEYDDPSVVKAVIDSAGHALYFSRAAIPHGWNETDQIAFRHIGLYAYRQEAQLKFASMPMSKLEIAENLEQLRLLENGYKVVTVVVKDSGMGVDTEEDLERIRGMIG